MTEEKKLASLKILLDATKSKLDLLLNGDNAFDSKASTIFALEGAVAIFYVTAISSYISYWSLTPLIILAISAYFIWRSIAPQKYNSGLVDINDKSLGYREKSEYDLVDQLLLDYQKAFDDNEKNLDQKNREYRNGMKLFVISVILMIIIVII